MHDYDFPIDVTLQLEQRRRAQRRHDVRPGIIDTLSDGNLNGGAQVAGTGTIDAAGTVGPIGGIRQKMYGAVGAGATYFLAPRDNCDEVVGHVPSGLRVFSVAAQGLAAGARRSATRATSTRFRPAAELTASWKVGRHPQNHPT
jgi:PDZ domain-containing protein